MRRTSIEDLLIWKGPKKLVPFPGLPCLSRRPNPTLVPGLVLLSDSKTQSVMALNIKNGVMVWRYELGSNGGFPVSHDKHNIYASTVTGVHCVEQKTGLKLWTFKPYGEEQESFYTDAILANKRVYLADRTGYLYCINSASGTLTWSTLSSIKEGDSINATPIVVGDKVYVVSVGGQLSCLKSSNGKLLWQIKLSEGSIRPPIVKKGKIYIQGRSSIFVVSLKTHKIDRLIFNGLIDMVISGTSIFVWDMKANVAKLKQVFDRSRRPKTIFKSQNLPFGFIPLKWSSHLAFYNSTEMNFFNLRKRTIDTCISGHFSSLPFVTKKDIFMLDFETEALCLRNPLRGDLSI